MNYFEEPEFEWRNVGRGLIKVLIFLLIVGLIVLILWFFANNLSFLWGVLQILFWIGLGIIGLIVIMLLVVGLLWGLNKLGAR